MNPQKIAEDLDVHEKTLYAWIRAYKEANGIEVPKQGKGKKSSIVQESEAEEINDPDLKVRSMTLIQIFYRDETLEKLFQEHKVSPHRGWGIIPEEIKAIT